MNYGKFLLVILALVVVAAGGFFVVRHFVLDRPGGEPTVIITTPPPQTSVSSETETTSVTLDAHKKNVLEKINGEGFAPNELGEIMVLMYHRIGAENIDYDRSVESFKQDLEILYQNGFRTISMDDYINSNIDVPAGTTPVILTFDDGDISHFKAARDSDGKLIPDPDCAVGILDDFYKKYPDFGRNAIFYLNAGAFGESEHLEWKLRYLLDNGYEVGNHTYGHDYLNQLNADEIQDTIGRNLRYYRNIYEKIEMNSMALPYGISPIPELEEYAVSGVYEDTAYENKVLLLVGWRPTWPLYTKGLNPAGINRVQCGEGEFQMTWWLDVYSEKPELRYISDGVPELITIPESEAEYINSELVDGESVLVY